AHDAAADPDRAVARLVSQAGNAPAFLHGRPARGLHDDAAGGDEDAQTHGRHAVSPQLFARPSSRPMKSRMSPMHRSVSAPARPMNPWRAPGNRSRPSPPPACSYAHA